MPREAEEPLAVTLQFVEGAAQRTAGGAGPVILAGDLLGLVQGGARRIGRLGAQMRVGGDAPGSVLGNLAKEERHGR